MNAMTTEEKKEQKRDELLNQAEAMRRILNSTSLTELEVIERYAKMWREIINHFELEVQRCATVDELIWISGINTNHNPCED